MLVDGIQTAASGGAAVLRILGECYGTLNAVTEREGVCVCACVCVCVCERERCMYVCLVEREKEKYIQLQCHV